MTEKLTFRTPEGSRLLYYTAIEILNDNDNFIVFVDKYGKTFTFRKDLLIRRGEC